MDNNNTLFKLSFTNLPFSLDEKELLNYLQECCERITCILHESDVNLYTFQLYNLYTEMNGECVKIANKCVNIRFTHVLIREMYKLSVYIIDLCHNNMYKNLNL